MPTQQRNQHSESRRRPASDRHEKSKELPSKEGKDKESSMKERGESIQHKENQKSAGCHHSLRAPAVCGVAGGAYDGIGVERLAVCWCR